jgi:multicomponent Na+:H+ antiporter subunit F
MIVDPTLILATVSRLSIGLLLVSIALACLRLVRGPQAADRVIALDLIAVLVVAFLAVYAIDTGNTSYMDVAIAYALVAFLGTVALARFLLRCRRHQDKDCPLPGRRP